MTMNDTRRKKAPGPKTSAAIQKGIDKHASLPLRPFLTLEEGDDGAPLMSPAHTDEEGHSAWLLSTLGTTSTSFLTQQLHSLEVATAGTAAGDQPNVPGLNAALALISAIDPQDELEGALATQMVGCHALSMAMLCRAKSTSRTDQLQLYGNLAVKLQRTFTAQIEALGRMRGKGQQTVRVEHVTVHSGAQAIVGDIHQYGPRGAGGRSTSEDQAHGTTQPAASTSLPSPDPLRDGVPLPGDEERPMPAARRPRDRRAKGQP